MHGEEASMLRLVVGILLFISGGITEWFVERHTPRFGVVQMAVAVLLITMIIFALAFWPKKWLRDLWSSRKH
jgi:uncharacterized membrane protein YoaK (UPF0700 family)